MESNKNMDSGNVSSDHKRTSSEDNEDTRVCLICKDEDTDFVTRCKHQFHMGNVWLFHGRHMIKLIQKLSFSTLKNDDKIILEKLEQLVTELRSTNSINSKVEIIKKKPELRPLLQLIYSPETKFYMTSAALQKYSNDSNNTLEYGSINDLLKALSSRTVTGKAAAQIASSYIKMYPEHEELIKNIIDKNLKTRIGYEIIKRSFDGMSTQSIPVTLGYSIEKHMVYLKKSLESNEKWFLSRKYDGIRSFLAYDSQEGSVKLLTRHMVPITGLNPSVIAKLQEVMRGIVHHSVILDGELVYIDKETGKEDFSKTITLVKSLEPKEIDGLEFRAFDIIEIGPFGERYEKLKDLLKSIKGLIKLVDQKIIHKDEFDYEKLIEESKKLNYEGYILRRECELKNGRSRDLLKIKPFHDAEFTVVDYEIGPMRLIDSDGKEGDENVLLSVKIDFRGQKVNVGSGFSNSERREFAKDPLKILNKIVTVRYQSESKKIGREEGNSLRFPIFKHLHGDKRTE